MQMQAEYLKAYVGSGTKLHIGYEYDLQDGMKMLRVQCGSRRGVTKIYTAGPLDLNTYADNNNKCEKCLEQVVAN